MNIVEDSNPWDIKPWHKYLFQNGAKVFTDHQPFFRLLPPDLHSVARKVFQELQEWANGPRFVYRVIAIADHNDEHADDRDAAHAFSKKLQKQGDAGIGNHWSRTWTHDHYAEVGAGLGYDPDAEGFPVLLKATVDKSEVLWGSTIFHNILYPHEAEITIEGTVHLHYAEVDDDFVQVETNITTGLYDESDYKDYK